jgi:TonB family protein
MVRLSLVVSLLLVAGGSFARDADRTAGACRLIYNPTPAYPLAVRRAYVPVIGSGTFSVMFDSSGKVATVKIIKSTGYPSLDDAAMSTLRTWKSAPGRPCSMVVPVKFNPGSSGGF